MELLILISVNIVSTAVIYFVFAIRFRVAVENARRAPIMKDLRENIEAAIEYIGTSIELMDRKSRSFQQAVSRAEQVAGRLEAALEAQTVAATPRKKRRGRDPAAPSAGPTTVEPPAVPDARPVPVDPLDRLVERLGSDRFSMSDLNATSGHSPALQAEGRPSRAAANDGTESAAAARWQWDTAAAGEPPAASPMGATGRGLGFVGSLISRIFGMNQPQVLSDLLSGRAAPLPPAEAQAFQDVLQAQAEGQEEPRETELREAPRPPGRGDRVLLSDEAIVAARRRENSRASPPATRPEAVSPRSVEEIPERRPELTRENDTSIEVGAIGRPPLSAFALAETRGERDPDPLLEQPPMEPAARRQYLRNLLGRGISPERISAATGISRAEIELTALLPARASAVRKHRREEV